MFSQTHSTLSVGINCALGAQQMRPYVKRLSSIADCYISCYPNAGLPDPLSSTGYQESPETTAQFLEEFAKSGFLNLVGGCCGTTPEHIEMIKQLVSQFAPRKIPILTKKPSWSGLESFELSESKAFFCYGGGADQRGRKGLVKLLLKKGADIHKRDNKGWSAVAWASHYGKMDSRSVLLNWGGSPLDTKIAGIKKPIRDQIQENKKALLKAVSAGKYGVVKNLVEEKGIDVNSIKGIYNQNVLSIAIQQKHTRTAKFLVKAGVNVNIKDSRGWTSLNWAVQICDKDMVKFLLKNGANPNAVDRRGKTILMWAVQSS